MLRSPSFTLTIAVSVTVQLATGQLNYLRSNEMLPWSQSDSLVCLVIQAKNCSRHFTCSIRVYLYQFLDYIGRDDKDFQYRYYVIHYKGLWKLLHTLTTSNPHRANYTKKLACRYHDYVFCPKLFLSYFYLV